jgi:hypothetical protein
MKGTILIIAITVIAAIAVAFAVMYLVTPKPNVVIMAKPYSDFKICVRTPSGLTTIVVSPRAILEEGPLAGDVKVGYSWRTYYVKTLLPNGTVITVMVKLQLVKLQVDSSSAYVPPGFLLPLNASISSDNILSTPCLGYDFSWSVSPSGKITRYWNLFGFLVANKYYNVTIVKGMNVLTQVIDLIKLSGISESTYDLAWLFITTYVGSPKSNTFTPRGMYRIALIPLPTLGKPTAITKVVTIFYNFTMPSKFTVIYFAGSRINPNFVGEYLEKYLGSTGWYNVSSVMNNSNVKLVFMNYTWDIYVNNGTMIKCIFEFPALLIRVNVLVNGTRSTAWMPLAISPTSPVLIKGKSYVDSIDNAMKKLNMNRYIATLIGPIEPLNELTWPYQYNVAIIYNVNFRCGLTAQKIFQRNPPVFTEFVFYMLNKNATLLPPS